MATRAQLNVTLHLRCLPCYCLITKIKDKAAKKQCHKELTTNEVGAANKLEIYINNNEQCKILKTVNNNNNNNSNNNNAKYMGRSEEG
jgi:hypothetical protein